jgi:hypothetical protein
LDANFRLRVFFSRWSSEEKLTRPLTEVPKMAFLREISGVALKN